MQQPNAMYYTVVPPNFSQGGTNFPGIFTPATTSWSPAACNSMLPNGTATPVSTAIYGTTSTFSWAHTVPAFMPWASKVGGQITDPVMRFTAPFPPDPCTSQTATSWELLHNLGTNNMNANLHLKRRSEGDDMSSIGPQKQYITEEKMAARMRELHISNQYSLPEQTSPFGPFGNSPGSTKTHKPITSVEELNATLAEELNEEAADPFSTFTSKCSIVLAPEIKKLVEPEKLFAKTFVEEIERPNMAVVLWEPPEGAIKKIMNSGCDSKREEERGVSHHSSSKSSSPFSQVLHQETNNNFISLQQTRNPVEFICPTPPSSPMPSMPCAILSTTVPTEGSASSQFDSDDVMDL